AVLLRINGGKAASAGWDGDRYAVFEAPKDRLGLVWLSTWDSEKDAREFNEGYTHFQTTKLGPGASQPTTITDSLRRSHQDVVFAIARRGADVAVVEGFSKDVTEQLLEAAFRAKKTEMTFSRPSDVKT